MNKKIKAAFPDLDISVQLIRLGFQKNFHCSRVFTKTRTSHVELAPADSVVDLAIVISRFYKPDKKEFEEHKSSYKALNDVRYVFHCLKSMGMVNIKHLKKENLGLGEFVDPASGQRCIIGVEKYIVFEREEFIDAYLKLDPRIRPVITAIFYFIRCHEPQNSMHKKRGEGECLMNYTILLRIALRDQFLSSYSHTFMILNYLMNALEYPMISSIQYLPNNKCQVNDCFYKKYKEPVSTIYGGQVRNLKIRYHTCVYIKNEDNKMKRKTAWTSHNKDNLGALLFGYFNYYSIRENISAGISIVHAGKGGSKARNCPITIQNPFLPLNNIA